MNKENDVEKVNAMQEPVEIEIQGFIGAPEILHQKGEGGARVSTYEKLERELKRLEKRGVKHVRVNICSQGGSVEEALRIYQALLEFPAVVETTCYGRVASAATIIAQAGDIRKLARGARYLIHQATTSVEGSAQEMKQAGVLLDAVDEEIAQIYAQRSARAVEEFREMMSRGRWMSSTEAVKAGLADEVDGISMVARMRQRIKEWLSPAMRNVGRTINFQREQRVGANNSSKERGGAALEDKNKEEKRAEVEENYISKEQLQAKATETLPCEDNHVEWVSPIATGNQSSYADDAEVFKG